MQASAKLYYGYRRVLKIMRLFAIIAGPGILVMVADNDAGGITTYSATGAKYGYNLIWFLLLLALVSAFFCFKAGGGGTATLPVSS